MNTKIRRAIGACTVAGAMTIAGIGVIAPSVASATHAHTGCVTVGASTNSGWCGLYPGNASDNVQYLGQTSLDSSGMLLTLQTISASDSSVPRTSFACLVNTPVGSITHRLQETQCTKAGGVWLTWSGPSLTIDLTKYAQFAGFEFTVQIAANGSAGNGNGDAFYNGFDVISRTRGY